MRFRFHQVIQAPFKVLTLIVVERLFFLRWRLSSGWESEYSILGIEGCLSGERLSLEWLSQARAKRLYVESFVFRVNGSVSTVRAKILSFGSLSLG